jgi:hypothetical protein
MAAAERGQKENSLVATAPCTLHHKVQTVSESLVYFHPVFHGTLIPIDIYILLFKSQKKGERKKQRGNMENKKPFFIFMLKRYLIF